MARFCFYCGRELSNGEKCGCRSTDKPNAAKESAAPKKPAGQPPPKAKPYKPQRPVTRDNLLNFFRQLKAYLTLPADTIRAVARQVNRQAILMIMLFSGLCGGLFLLVAVQQPLLTSLLSLSAATSTGSPSGANGVFIFVQGLGISIVSSLLLVLLYYLALRFIYRHQVAFLDLLSALSPSFLYLSLFVLLGTIGLSTSFLSSLLMLAIGFAIAIVAQYLAVCELSGFDDNRGLMLVVFVLLIYASVLSLVLSLSLPILKAFVEQSVTL